MDVSRLMRAVLGEPAPAESKVLELKPGQVIRGIVLQLLAENEALMNLGGVSVRAKLETPIAAGQAALFQVQPESGAGLVLLKPFSSSTADIPTESFTQVLQTFGMKDTPENRAIVRILHEEGVPMSRAANAAVAAAVTELSPSGDADGWIRAAATAVKRGLPVTADTVRALHTAITGPTPTEMFHALEQGAREALSAPQTSARVMQAATRLLEVLQRAETLLVQALQPQAAAEGAAGAPRAPVSAAATAMPQAAAQEPGARPFIGLAPEGTPPATRGGYAEAPAAVPGAPKAPQPQATAQAGAAAGGPPSEAQLSQARPLQSQLPQAQPQSAGQVSSPPPAEGERPPLLSFLKLMGVDVEREWLKLANTPVLQPPQSATPQQPPAPEAPLPAERLLAQGGIMNGPGAEDAARTSERTPLETLKTVLTQLAGESDVPPALKDAAQTALQSVTGQQLLMAQDRTVPFAHVTMFIPLNGKDGGGDGDAAVHIHTRRGKKGELDAENCRLWFQLSLASLGETWVDVAVTNKIVGLHVWNDHPASQALMEAYKPDMESALREIGYQLLTFRHSPKPKESPADSGAAGNGAARQSVSAAYAPKTYKGVDLRV